MTVDEIWAVARDYGLRMIHSEPSVPHQIMQAEFAMTPLELDAIF